MAPDITVAYSGENIAIKALVSMLCKKAKGVKETKRSPEKADLVFLDYSDNVAAQVEALKDLNQDCKVVVIGGGASSNVWVRDAEFMTSDILDDATFYELATEVQHSKAQLTAVRKNSEILNHMMQKIRKATYINDSTRIAS